MADPIHIPIDRLVLDLENPRQYEQSSEEEAINDLFQFSKLQAIIESILEDGFHKVNLPLVKRKGPDSYVVRDGNRRVAALKVIRRPEIISSEKNRQAIEKLIEKHTFSVPRTILCQVSDNEDEIVNLIKLHHASGQDGRGTRAWDAIMKARSEFGHGKESANTFSLKIIDDLFSARKIAGDQYRDYPITTLSRVVASSAFKQFFSMNPSHGGKEYIRQKNDEKEKLQKLAHYILKNKTTSRNIYSVEQIKEFLKKYWAEEVDNNGGRVARVPKSPPKVVMTRKKRPQKKVLFDAQKGERPCQLTGEEFGKIEKILDELEKLELSKFNFAVASLFRVYLDILTSSIDIKPIEEVEQRFVSLGRPIKMTLKDRLISLLHHLQTPRLGDYVLGKQQAQSIRTELDRKFGICNVTTIQTVLHNPHYYIDADSLQTQWANLRPLLILIHYHVNRAGKSIFAE